MRTALGTGIRLRMKTARGGCVVFELARRALRELRHAGVGTVVGQTRRQRVARSAVDTVNEGMAITTVGGIKQFRQAIRADRHVGHDAGLHFARLACRDGEALQADSLQHQIMRVFFHTRQGGRFALQELDQTHHLRLLALDRNLHALAIVAHPARQPELMGKLKDERSETYALDLACYSDLRVDHCIHSNNY